MIKLETFEVGPLLANCYLVYDEAAGEGIMIDLGYWDPRIPARVSELGLTIRDIYLTHGHFDHIDGVNAARQSWLDVVVHMHPGDEEFVASQAEIVETYLPGYSYVPPSIDTMLVDGELVKVGDSVFRITHTPGHSPGSVSVIGDTVAFTGDTLFAGSVGHTYYGDEDALLASLRDRLLTLPDATRIFPGHGPETTIAKERANNPYLQGLV